MLVNCFQGLAMQIFQLKFTRKKKKEKKKNTKKSESQVLKTIMEDINSNDGL